MATNKSRSQPARQARTNPIRRPGALPSRSAQPGNPLPSPSAETDSFPALVAFTDALEALPAEIVRNFTLLREVDAKAYHPEDQLRGFINRARELPAGNPGAYDAAIEFLQKQEELGRVRDECFRLGEPLPQECEFIVENVHEVAGQYPETRRSRLQQVRMKVADLLPTMDEKIHVISTTCETLQKHLERLEDSFRGIQQEIPELHRLGNLEHWAYKPIPPRGTLAARAAAERAALAQAAAAAQASNSERDAEMMSRQERREAMAAKRALHNDEDDVPLSKRHGNKSHHKKVDDTKDSHKKKDTPSNGKDDKDTTPLVQKRRKPIPTEKSKELNNNGGSRSGTPAPAKRIQKPSAVGGNNRRRATAASSAAASPSMASSPLLATFPPQVLERGNAPSPSGLAIAISAAAPGEQIPTPTTKSHKKGASAAQEKGAERRGSRVEEVMATRDEKPKVAHSVPATPQIDQGVLPGHKPASLPPASRAASPPPPPLAPSSPSKRKRPNSPPFPGPSKRSKTPPTLASSPRKPAQSPIIPPPTPSRPHPSASTSSNAPPPSSNRPRQTSTTPTPPSTPDPTEETYCFCNQVSYGQMVACDSGFCKYEWFHLPCVGLSAPPKGKAKWFCEDCRGSGRLRGEGRGGRRK